MPRPIGAFIARRGLCQVPASSRCPRSLWWILSCSSTAIAPRALDKVEAERVAEAQVVADKVNQDLMVVQV